MTMRLKQNEPTLRLVPERHCGLTLSRPGRPVKGYEQQTLRCLQGVLKTFQSEAKAVQGERMTSVRVKPPSGGDEDWLRLVLLACEVCGARYVPENAGDSGVFCLRVYGEGRRCALATQLVAFLWPLFVQFRRRHWQHHMRSLRRQTGVTVQVTRAARQNWRQQNGAQWVLSLWQALPDETLSPSEVARLARWRQNHESARTFRCGKED